METNKDFVLIGKIVGAHGVRGTLKVQLHAESLEIFKPGTTLLVIDPKNRKTSCKINWIKAHLHGVLLAFREISNRDQATELLGSELYIESGQFPKLETGAYYWFELIGLNVYTIDNRYIGRLESIIETGANDVYVVKKHNKEILIPALKSVVRLIDIGQKIMRVELPEGLEDR
ncbi:MAG: ribosome maturation factor RimM [Desulfobacterales bacterium]